LKFGELNWVAGFSQRAQRKKTQSSQNIFFVGLRENLWIGFVINKT
jgi:hypothetical protein